MKTDPRVLTAMAHPLRRRLLDVLHVYGPRTASALAELTGAAVGNISHHMKVLADAALVEEAPELARDRRERWWRQRPGGLSWSVERDGGPAAEAIGMAAESLNLDRQIAFVRQALAATDAQRAVWPEGPFSTDSWLRVTPAELTEFSREINEIIVRWATRDLPEDGQQRMTVFAFARAVPATP